MLNQALGIPDRPPAGFWCAIGARQTTTPPQPGRYVAYNRAVWRVETLTLPVELDDRDRVVWETAGCPDPAMPERWSGWPYRVDMLWVGGHRPAPPEADGIDLHAVIRTGASRWGAGHWWNVYPKTGRWPRCSCCGEPMPCHADQIDTQTDAAIADLEQHTAKLPGCCWHCGQPITHRQDAVTYDGDNLDLPAGPAVQFHTRSACITAARTYEARWIAGDPRRERILTWPDCGGILIVHADGSTQCRPGWSLRPDLFDPDRRVPGRRRQPAADCRGWLTHDHATQTTCQAAATEAALDYKPAPCTCPTDRHWWKGDVLPPRPARRDRQTLH